MNNREVGKRYEEQAAEHLKSRGFRLMEQNFRCRQGEIDLIGIHENCLVFVEVKYRKNIRSGLPEEAVDQKKQQKICGVSDYYRCLHPEYAAMQVRYDVAAIRGDSITWYQNAFDYRRKKEKLSW